MGGKADLNPNASVTFHHGSALKRSWNGPPAAWGKRERVGGGVREDFRSDGKKKKCVRLLVSIV